MMKMKLKRKDLDEVNDDFSDFSLSSPARKIRRLDAELPPIMEEEEAEIPPVFEQSREEQNFASNVEQVGSPIIEELPTLRGNEERSIVLFKPMNSPLMKSPSNFSVSVNSNIISGFKNQVLWSSHSKPVKAAVDEAVWDRNSRATNECFAVVPWVPSQFPPVSVFEDPQTTDVSESMEAEEMEASTMDIEDDNVGVEQTLSVADGLNQWQQQHCMIPQPPRNTTTPVVWFR